MAQICHCRVIYDSTPSYLEPTIIIPHQVIGAPIEPLQVNQFTLSEKASYKVRKPSVGELVLFRVEQDQIDYIGVIVGKEGDTYKIRSSGTKPTWDVDASMIIAKVYYPSLTGTQVKTIINTAPTVDHTATPVPSMEPVPSPTPTPKPSLKPSVKPSPKPSAIPSPSPSITPTPSPTLTPSPSPTPTPSPSPTPTPRTPNPPQVSISFPSEGQVVELTTSQTLCIVDVPTGGDITGATRAYSLNGSTKSSFSSAALCIDNPAEGTNTLQMWWRNSYGDESGPVTRNFIFHRI